jgi:hypothetical protein
MHTLARKADNVYRFEQHYQKDTEGTNCGCLDVMKTIYEDDKKHIAMLEAELKMHYERGDVD